MMTTEECIIYDNIVENGIATAKEINLVRNIISGPWEKIFNDIIEVRTGCKNFDEYIAEQMEED